MRNASTAPTRASYHHGDLRNALLEASLALVADQGVERFSLREAARAVGVSPAAAYRHFQDKDALLRALAFDAFGRLAVAMDKGISRAAGEPGTRAHALAAFLAAGQAYVEFAVQHPAYFRVMFGPWCGHQDEEAQAEAPPQARRPYQILVESLDALAATGAIRAEARAGAEIAVWASVHGLASLMVEGTLTLTRAERVQALRQMGRVMLVGLGCDAAALGPAGPPVADLCPRGAPATRR